MATAAHRPTRVQVDTGDNFVLGTDDTADTVTRLTTTAWFKNPAGNILSVLAEAPE